MTSGRPQEDLRKTSGRPQEDLRKTSGRLQSHVSLMSFGALSLSASSVSRSLKYFVLLVEKMVISGPKMVKLPLIWYNLSLGSTNWDSYNLMPKRDFLNERSLKPNFDTIESSHMRGLLSPIQIQERLLK